MRPAPKSSSPPLANGSAALPLSDVPIPGTVCSCTCGAHVTGRARKRASLWFPCGAERPPWGLGCVGAAERLADYECPSLITSRPRGGGGGGCRDSGGPARGLAPVLRPPREAPAAAGPARSPARRARFSGEPRPGPWPHEAAEGCRAAAAAAGLRRRRSWDGCRRWVTPPGVCGRHGCRGPSSPRARPGLGEGAGGSGSAAPPGGPGAARGGRAGGTGGPRRLPGPGPAGLRDPLEHPAKFVCRSPGLVPPPPRCPVVPPARPRGAPGKRGWSRAAAFVRPLLQRRGEEREALPLPLPRLRSLVKCCASR